MSSLRFLSSAAYCSASLTAFSISSLERFVEEAVSYTHLDVYKRQVLALLADSTNVEKPGYSTSERKVGETFDALFRGCDQRIIVTTFASNVHRIQQVIDTAAKYGRKVAITGRSMENILKVSVEQGYMKIPDGCLLYTSQVRHLRRLCRFSGFPSARPPHQ